jgi:hypothetical protein
MFKLETIPPLFLLDALAIALFSTSAALYTYPGVCGELKAVS